MPKAPQKLNSYVIFDTETGGLDKKNNQHSQVVAVTEIACIAIDGTTLQDIVRYDNLIKPYDPKLEYQAEAARITGITKELCEKEGVGLRQVVEDLCQVFEEANIYKSKISKPILIAQNSGYDFPFLQDMFKRANVDLSKYVEGVKDNNGNFVPKTLDTIDFAKMIEGDKIDTTTKFNQAAICQRAGIDLVMGHRAMADVIPLTDFVRYMITRIRSGSNDITVANGVAVNNHRTKFEW